MMSLGVGCWQASGGPFTQALISGSGAGSSTASAGGGAFAIAPSVPAALSLAWPHAVVRAMATLPPPRPLPPLSAALSFVLPAVAPRPRRGARIGINASASFSSA